MEPRFLELMFLRKIFALPVRIGKDYPVAEFPSDHLIAFLRVIKDELNL